VPHAGARVKIPLPSQIHTEFYYVSAAPDFAVQESGKNFDCPICCSPAHGNVSLPNSKWKENLGRAKDSFGLFLLPPCRGQEKIGKAEEEIGRAKEEIGKAEEKIGQKNLSPGKGKHSPAYAKENFSFSSQRQLENSQLLFPGASRRGQPNQAYLRRLRASGGPRRWCLGGCPRLQAPGMGFQTISQRPSEKVAGKRFGVRASARVFPKKRAKARTPNLQAAAFQTAS